MARPIAETFRESVRHVDFFENDLVLTEDVAMPDSEAGLEYSAYVERVEDRLGLAVKDVVFARGEDLDFAYASSHGDDVLSSISRDLVNRFLGDNLRAEGDVRLSDAKRSGNGWLRDGLKDGLSEQLFDMIRCSRMGDRDDTNVGWKFVEDVAAGNCVDSGIARHVRNPEERGALWETLGAGELLSAAEGKLDFPVDDRWLSERLWELSDQVRHLSSNAWNAISRLDVEHDEELVARAVYMKTLEEVFQKEPDNCFSSDRRDVDAYVNGCLVEYVVDGGITDSGRDRLKQILDAVATMPEFDAESLRDANRSMRANRDYDPLDYIEYD